MFGRLLCWFGWHDWGYLEAHGHRTKLDRRAAASLHDSYRDGTFRCLRCGIRP